jgi:hypothetical protein
MVISQMNTQEAKKIIADQLKPYREKSYSELVKMVKQQPLTYEVRGQSGALYQIEIQAFWDDRPNDNIRIMGSIDDGGLRAYSPLSDDFIKSPTDEFVGE